MVDIEMKTVLFDSPKNLLPSTCLNFYLNFKTKREKWEWSCFNHFCFFNEISTSTQNPAENGKEVRKKRYSSKNVEEAKYFFWNNFCMYDFLVASKPS